MQRFYLEFVDTTCGSKFHPVKLKHWLVLIVYIYLEISELQQLMFGSIGR